jgi:hypothetical protein
MDTKKFTEMTDLELIDTMLDLKARSVRLSSQIQTLLTVLMLRGITPIDFQPPSINLSNLKIDEDPE